MSDYSPLRGGGWSTRSEGLRSTYSGLNNRTGAVNFVGFRLVLKKVNHTRPLCGGSWVSFGNYCRSSYRDYRDYFNPDRRYNDFGFRLILRRLT